MTELDRIDAILAALDGHLRYVFFGILGMSAVLQIQVDTVALHRALYVASIRAHTRAHYIRQVRSQAWKEDQKNEQKKGNEQGCELSRRFTQLQLQIRTVLEKIGQKRDAFGDFAPVVSKALGQLRQDVDAFTEGVLHITSFDAIQHATDTIESTRNSFDSTIEVYRG